MLSHSSFERRYHHNNHLSYLCNILPPCLFPANNNSYKSYLVVSLTLLVIIIYIYLAYSIAATNNDPNQSIPAIKQSISSNFHMSELSAYSSYYNLVLVAGHATLKSLNNLNERTILDPSSWHLLSFQIPEVPTFLEHIKAGISELYNDPAALLLFSGGLTRKATGSTPISEGQSYFEAARVNTWFESQFSTVERAADTEISSRIFTEDHARDSYENLLFSICRFYELTGHFPHKITVIGFEFKRSRFTELHRSALQFPAQNFRYVGIDPINPLFDAEAAKQGEYDNAIVLFRKNPFGCEENLLKKRQIRNPYNKGIPYSSSVPILADFLAYCGPRPYSKPLPWVQDNINKITTQNQVVTQ
jgi:hypothetical protein